jgi:hypothetical protein
MEAVINDTPIVTSIVEIIIKEYDFIFQGFEDQVRSITIVI